MDYLTISCVRRKLFLSRSLESGSCDFCSYTFATRGRENAIRNTQQKSKYTSASVFPQECIFDREAERDQENERKSDSLQSVLPREDSRSGETDIFIAPARSARIYFAAVAGRTFIDVRRLRGVLVTVEFEGPHADLGILPGIGRGAPAGPHQMVGIREMKQKEARTRTYRSVQRSLDSKYSGIRASSYRILSPMLQKGPRQHANQTELNP